VNVDWDRVPFGLHHESIVVRGADGQSVALAVEIDNRRELVEHEWPGYVEVNNYVSIEAENFAEAIGAAPIHWQVIPQLGRTQSAVTALPATAPSSTPTEGDGPRLQYNTLLVNSGEIEVHAYLCPSLDFRGGNGLRYAVSIDDEPPQIVNMHADGSHRAWQRAVANNLRVGVSRHRIEQPGSHTVKFWRVDPGVVLQKLVVTTGGLPPSYLGPPESPYRVFPSDQH
jgi:hypothetical protein